MLKKNDSLIVDITDITNEGYGVCRHENYVIFVLGCATGDKAEIKMLKVLKNFGYGKLVKLITPSPIRIENECPSFPSCGGCVFRHIEYAEELKIKKSIVEHNFKSIGGINIEPLEITGSPLIERYRNKAEYPAIQVGNNIKFGFYARNSHRVISCDDCLLQPDVFKPIVECIQNYCDKNKIKAYNSETKTGTIKHLYIRCGIETNEIMVCLVSRKSKLINEHDLVSSLLRTNEHIKSVVLDINSEDSNVILSNNYRILYGSEVIHEKLNGLSFIISPLSFFQINKYVTELLYNRVCEYASPCKDDVILDLYCGTGTIGLTMAGKGSKLLGVEIVKEAIDNAVINASNNNITNAEFICGDISKISNNLHQKIQPSIVILDPPRSGIDDNTINQVVQLGPKKIVMVSCNSSTAARDCKLFVDNNYSVTQISAFDMFPRTGHVETVVLLTLNNQK